MKNLKTTTVAVKFSSTTAVLPWVLSPLPRYYQWLICGGTEGNWVPLPFFQGELSSPTFWKNRGNAEFPTVPLPSENTSQIGNLAKLQYYARMYAVAYPGFCEGGEGLPEKLDKKTFLSLRSRQFFWIIFCSDTFVTNFSPQFFFYFSGGRCLVQYK